MPHADDDLATGISLDCHPKESGDAPCILDLPGITSVDEKNADAPGNGNDDDALEEDSEHDLLHQLSASVIESCRGTDFAEPRCYLQVLGFKSPEMETAYLACHARTSLTGHRILASALIIYLLFRIINLLRGVNFLKADALVTFYLCTLGVVVVISASCGFYLSGQEVKHRESLTRASTGVGLLAFSGLTVQYVSVLYFQTDWYDGVSETFQMAYSIGMMTSILPAFCLVMVRTPFLLCGHFSLSRVF